MHEKLWVIVLLWPHVAYKLIRGNAILAIPPTPFFLPCHQPPFLCQPLPSLHLAGRLLPACLVPRLRFQNFLLQATFRAASVLCMCVCARVCLLEWVSLSDFLLSPLPLSPLCRHASSIPYPTDSFSTPLFIWLKPHLCARQMQNMSADINDPSCNKHN